MCGGGFVFGTSETAGREPGFAYVVRSPVPSSVGNFLKMVVQVEGAPRTTLIHTLVHSF